MRDGPAGASAMSDAPPIEVLLLRADWRRDPLHLFDAPYTHAWQAVNLLQVPHYLNLGYIPIALDPVSEAAYRRWRAADEDGA